MNQDLGGVMKSLGIDPLKPVMIGGILNQPQKTIDYSIGDTVSHKATIEELAVGDFVQWEAFGGIAQGQIDLIVTDGMIQGSDGILLEGTPENPVYRVCHYELESNGWVRDDECSLHRAPALTKIEPLTIGTDEESDAVEMSLKDPKSNLKAIVDAMNQNKATEIAIRVVEDATESNGFDLHMGEPTADQLAKINALTGEEWSASDWFVCAWYASDNLVDHSRSRWHLNVLQQMTATQTGKVLIKNHDWRNVDTSVGFAFDAALIVDDNPDPKVINTMFADHNQKIVDSMGLVRMIVWTALSSDNPAVEGLKRRRLNDCSTGGTMNNIKEYCPNCTEEKGREVSFWEVDKEGDYICPHIPPYPFLLMWYGDDPDMNWADYIVIDGQYESVELSIVQSGCLPAAEVVRE